jgi:hypothetical protein
MWQSEAAPSDFRTESDNRRDIEENGQDGEHHSRHDDSTPDNPVGAGV